MMLLYTALYRLGVGAYAIAVRIAALFNGKAKLFTEGRKDLLVHISTALAGDTRRRIWMHCASLGEFEQGRPVLEALRYKYPGHCIVLTFFSPSGYEVRKNYDGADHVFYLPIDTPANATAFLDIVQPSLCLFVKYEFWYYYLSGISKRGIPAVLISAIFNKDQGFFKWYGSLQRQMLRCFTYLFVQDAASLQLLTNIGITNAAVSGDTRFDRVIKVAAQHAELPIAAAFAAGHKILVAGSTWKEDEVMLHAALPSLPSGWKMILVPHEVNESHLGEIEKLFGYSAFRWSRMSSPANAVGAAVLIVDKVGFLSQLYRYGTAAWIGGGFGKEGVHNVLEAAVYGVPCFWGPVYDRFIEARELIAQGGAVSVTDADMLIAALRKADSGAEYTQRSLAAKNYVHAHSGATDIVLTYLEHCNF